MTISEVPLKASWSPSVKISHGLGFLIAFVAAWESASNNIVAGVGAFLVNALIAWLIPYAVSSWGAKRHSKQRHEWTFFIMVLVCGLVVVGAAFTSKG
jgi:hypothetical protein